MYLAKKFTSRGIRYFLRESYREGGVWKFRDIVDLGDDPSVFIRYPGGKSFYVDEALEEEIRSKGVVTDQWELERIFFKFVKPEVREYLRPFVFRRVGSAVKLPREEQLRLQRSFHPFDVRRLIFIKFGASDPDRLLRRPLPFLNVLKDKSRDEIEQLIWEKEERLKSKEVIPYIYASFGLWKKFRTKLTRFLPEAQRMEEMDEAFLECFCEVVRDPAYRMGLSEDTVIKDYLFRYVSLYFDRTQEVVRILSEVSERRVRSSVLYEASEEFGISVERLLRMSRKELLSLFRERAKRLHPDVGGSKEEFVKLRALFERLMEFFGYRKRF